MWVPGLQQLRLGFEAANDGFTARFRVTDRSNGALFQIAYSGKCVHPVLLGRVFYAAGSQIRFSLSFWITWFTFGRQRRRILFTLVDVIASMRHSDLVDKLFVYGVADELGRILQLEFFQNSRSIGTDRFDAKR